ncbi:MAG: (d)CMP kinase [Mycobacteriales bacterium]
MATRLKLRYLDTGAMYRAVTWRVLEAGVNPDDAPAVVTLATAMALEVTTDPGHPLVRVDGRVVTRAIRSGQVTGAVSAVSAIPELRHLLVRRQRDLIAAARPGIVAEGRDIGTVVAPDALVKVFLTASPSVRARRRGGEAGTGTTLGLAEVEQALLRRDRLDSGRAASPLRVAADAVELDSTHLSVAEVVLAVVERCRAAGFPGAA